MARMQPDAVRQAQRFARGGAPELVGGALADYLERIRVDTERQFKAHAQAVVDGAAIHVEAGSARETLERLDHNLDDLRSPDEGNEDE